MKKKKTFAFVIGWENYAAHAEKFFAEHPDCTIIEEVKTLSYHILEDDLPSGIIKIGTQAMPQVIVTLTWGIIIEEDE